MTNSADQDQLGSDQKPSDLDLHCLHRQGHIRFQQEQGLILPSAFSILNNSEGSHTAYTCSTRDSWWRE